MGGWRGWNPWENGWPAACFHQNGTLRSNLCVDRSHARHLVLPFCDLFGLLVLLLLSPTPTPADLINLINNFPNLYLYGANFSRKYCHHSLVCIYILFTNLCGWGESIRVLVHTSILFCISLHAIQISVTALQCHPDRQTEFRICIPGRYAIVFRSRL